MRSKNKQSDVTSHIDMCTHFSKTAYVRWVIYAESTVMATEISLKHQIIKFQFAEKILSHEHFSQFLTTWDDLSVGSLSNHEISWTLPPSHLFQAGKVFTDFIFLKEKKNQLNI